MRSFRTILACLLLGTSMLPAAESLAQSPSSAGDIEKQLLSLYPTAKATADGTDIVTAGAVLVLQKDHLLMCKVDQAVPTANFYKNGAIGQGAIGGIFKTLGALSKLGNVNPGAGDSAAPTTREFVAGEKFWVTQIDTRGDGMVFTLMSDPIKDQRYKATLKFPFAKGALPTPDDASALVAEVIKIDAPAADQAASGESAAAPAPAATKTIAVGQTRDQVIALFGVPTKIVQLGTKEIDYFPDMKVTFVKNKVTDVQ